MLPKLWLNLVQYTKILLGLPESQHCLTDGRKLATATPQSKNEDEILEKTTGTTYTKEILLWISPKAENYKHFVGVLTEAAKQTIAQTFLKEYITYWNQNTGEMLRVLKISQPNHISAHSTNHKQITHRNIWSYCKRLGAHTIQPKDLVIPLVTWCCSMQNPN